MQTLSPAAPEAAETTPHTSADDTLLGASTAEPTPTPAAFDRPALLAALGLDPAADDPQIAGALELACAAATESVAAQTQLANLAAELQAAQTALAATQAELQAAQEQALAEELDGMLASYEGLPEDTRTVLRRLLQENRPAGEALLKVLPKTAPAPAPTSAAAHVADRAIDSGTPPAPWHGADSTTQGAALPAGENEIAASTRRRAATLMQTHRSLRRADAYAQAERETRERASAGQPLH